MTEPRFKLDLDQSDFIPGETVSGAIIVDCDKDVEVRSIKLVMSGGAQVHWTEVHSRRYGERNDVYRVNYDSSLSFFSLQQTLLEPEDGYDTTVLPKGKQRLKFRIRLPYDAPSTSVGAHGVIGYTLELRAFLFGSPVHVGRVFPLRVLSGIDAGSEEYDVPCDQMSESRKLYKWCCLPLIQDGSLSIKCSLDRSGFAPGDTALVLVSYDNSSSKSFQPVVCLLQTQMFFAEGNSKCNEVEVARLNTALIGPRSKGDLPVKLLLPPYSMYSVYNCDIFHIDYYVKVCVSVHIGSEITLRSGIIIGEHTSAPLSPSDPDNSKLPETAP